MRPWAGSAQILVLDPPPFRLTRVAEMLARRGHRLCRVESADAALARLAGPGAVPPADLLLMRRPETPAGGLDLLVRIRRASQLPVVVQGGPLCASRDRVAALELGADEVLDPQMSPAEALARIQAVLRRAAWGAAATAARASAPLAEARQAPAIQGGWRLSPHRRAVVHAQLGESVALTGAEFELLRLLTAAHGEPVEREAISRIVFRRPWQLEDRAVDGLVKRLRRKLRTDAIATVRGVGYALRFAEPAGAGRSAAGGEGLRASG